MSKMLCNMGMSLQLVIPKDLAGKFITEINEIFPVDSRITGERGRLFSVRLTETYWVVETVISNYTADEVKSFLRDLCKENGITFND